MNGNHATSAHWDRAKVVDTEGSALMFSLRKHRFWILSAAHVVLLTLAYLTAFLLRFDMALPETAWQMFVVTLPFVLVTKLVALYWFGTPAGSFRFVSFADLVNLTQGCLLGTAIIICVDFFAIPSFQVPRSVAAIDLCLTILALSLLRGSWRYATEHVQPIFSGRNRSPVLVIGANNEGQRYLQFLRTALGNSFQVVGCLENDMASRRTRLGGVSVLGEIKDLPEIARQQRIEHVFVMTNSLPGSDIRELVDVCRREQIRLRMLPSVEEMLTGHFQRRIRDVDINDLLRREPVELDKQVVSPVLNQRCVMVTGAAGSIGSELCRQIVRCRPEKLILVDRTENSLFRIEQELKQLDVPMETVLADVTDVRHMDEVFSRYRPEIILHAAAHKHVPLMEKHPTLAVRNNVRGTKVVADLAVQYGARRFVQISTDKAVQPSSIMGATKNLAEKYVNALGQTIDSTKFVVVRFGNVLASDGSVVPTFNRQIAQGGPVTITDERMERFFMTIPEAAQLVLHAAAMGSGGEVFVLDMGQPVRIVDLARDMIRLSGHSLEEIPIKTVGIRPGEKLTEALFDDDSQLLSTQHPRINACYQNLLDLEEVKQVVEHLTSLDREPADVIRREVHQAVEQLAGEGMPQEATVHS